MAIFDRQYQELLTRELLKVLLKGTLPNVQELTKHLTESTKDKKVLYQFIPQAKRDTFNNTLFNRQLNAINFDTSLLHQELLSQLQDAMRRLNYADLYHKVHSYELHRLGSLLNSILFTFENADFFFLSAFDSFADYSKTDRTVSTTDVISLSEKALALPYGGRATQRVKTEHMYDNATWPVTILQPGPNSSVTQAHSQVSSTRFGSIFSDVVEGWMYEVITNEHVPTSLRFEFPLAGLASAEKEVQVNRFELVPFSVSPQQAKIEFSTDNVNWKAPEGYEAGILLEDQKLTYAFDFITELVQFVRITLSKTDFDEEPLTRGGGKQFLYRFGLKGFSAYSTGRLQQARYQSKPFSFVGQEENIARVSIKADTSTPSGTSVNFSVALADDAGAVTTNFLPIKPTNSDAKPGATEVVTFGTTEPHSFRFSATAGQFAERETFRGHTYHKFTRPILPTPLFGTAFMTRGHQAWYRDSNVALTRTEVKDNHISFSKADIEHLYSTTTEVPIHRSFTEANTATVELTTNRSVYYTQGVHDLIPSFSQSSGDMTPTYAVYRVEAITDRPSPTFSVTTNNLTTIQLPAANFVLVGADAPVVQNAARTVTFTPGRDYVLETEFVGGQSRPTGYLSIVPPAEGGSIYFFSTNVVLSVSLVLDADVTYKVSGIEANKVTLRNMILGTGDSFKITYRYVPIPPNTIEKSSVRVKDSISSSPSAKFFIEGVDYVLNTATGAIQRLPNGSIGDKASVFVDYLFRNAEENIETFLTWCFISGSDGLRIPFDLDPTSLTNALVADESLGEQFLVNTASGLIDLTRAEKSPVLGPGWTQFIVKSKNPDVNQQSNGKGNLIDQVIQARDRNKKRIFKEKGSYFKDILALRDPMTQVSLNQLRVNTLPSSHTVFAIDETRATEPLVVLNFNPGDTEELYLKIPQDDSSSEPHPLSFYEVFGLSWQSKIASENNGSSVVLRCDLVREPDIDGGVTPKVFEYFLRASEL